MYQGQMGHPELSDSKLGELMTNALDIIVPMIVIQKAEIITDLAQ
jgi:hypothetical protein